MKGPRHKRFLSKPTLRCPLIQDYSRRGSLTIILLLLLSGDVELNPGPTGNQVKCVCSVNKDSGHMLQCEHCLQWCHSKCVNIPASLASTYPFVCPSCVKEAVTILSNVQLDLSNLKSRLSKVEETCKQIPAHVKSLGESLDAVSLKVKALPHLSSPNKPMTNSPMLQKNASSYPSPNPVSSSTTRTSSSLERKFNVVIFGLNESPKGTVRQTRVMNDYKSAAATLNFLDSNLDTHSIRDCIRLGKYSDGRKRPLLVRLIRSCEAMHALSQGHKLSKRPGVFIKPDLSPEERSVQSLLLRERKILIDSGTDRKNIKLFGNVLFVNNQKYGVVKGLEFHRLLPVNHNTSSTSLDTVSPSTNIPTSATNAHQANSSVSSD